MSSEVHAGKEGWLFLTGGEHRVIDLYAEESAFTPDMAKQWVSLVQSRADQLTARGIDYVHLIVPDKLTLLNRHYADALPNEDGGPIRQLQSRHAPELHHFLDVVAYLKNGIDKYPVYWKTDNHWTAWGCFMAYQLLCSRLQIPTNTQILNYPFNEEQTSQGLAARIGQDSQSTVTKETVRTYSLNKFSERVYANHVVRYRENLNLDKFSKKVSDAKTDATATELDRISRTMLDGHGSHVVYENNSPDAVDKKIVLFGDSFSDYKQNLLTGMLAETVKEVHFIWSRSVDHEYIRQIRPDIVISQCAEASMTDVPTDTGNTRLWGDQGLESLESAVKTASQHDLDFRGMPQPGVMARRTPLLGRETYDLGPPVLTQTGFDTANQEMAMQTNPVSLVELDSPRLFFNGAACHLQAANGNTIFRYGIDNKTESNLKHQEFKRLPGRSFLLAPTAGAHCYYHWMLDILPKLGLLERNGISLDSIEHFLVRKITGDFQRETLARLGINESRIVETVGNQYLHCDQLLHVDMNNGINLKMNRFVPLWLKQTYLRQSDNTDRLKLYIGRPDGVRRGILNEDEIKPLVEAAGFTMVVMEGMSVAEQAELLSRADALMAPHGGALTNMVFCKPGIPVIELLSRHVYPYYYGLSELCGHKYHAIMADPGADYSRLVNHRIAQANADPDLQWRTQNESFTVDVEAVKRMLDLLPE